MNKFEVVCNIIIMVLANVISKIINDIIEDKSKINNTTFIGAIMLTVLTIIILSAFGFTQ